MFGPLSSTTDRSDKVVILMGYIDSVLLVTATTEKGWVPKLPSPVRVIWLASYTFATLLRRAK